MPGLSEWTPNTTTDVVCTLDLVTPLVDLASCNIFHAGLSSARRGANMHLNAFYDHGFITGATRTILRMDVLPAEDNINTHAGLVCMQSNLSIYNTVGAGYLFGWGQPLEAPFDWPDMNFTLFKLLQGGLAGADVDTQELVTTTSFTVVEGDFYPIEMRWDYNVKRWGGLKILCSIGALNSNDYRTLTPVIDLVDTDPFTTSVGEGIYSRKGSAADVEIMSHTFDTTGIFDFT